MKIDDKTTTYEINKYVSKPTQDETEKIEQKQTTDAQKTEGADRSEQDTVVNLSQASKEAQRIEEIILSEPDVREEKVAELKRKIESGEYEIDHDAVADKLVDSFIDEIS
ncbi:MAG: flagellar biosynthesis anti-sigma factor FlgM [Desulfatiglandales bacterium]